jgi:hypothetical protein
MGPDFQIPTVFNFIEALNIRKLFLISEGNNCFKFGWLQIHQSAHKKSKP